MSPYSCNVLRRERHSLLRSMQNVILVGGSPTTAYLTQFNLGFSVACQKASQTGLNGSPSNVPSSVLHVASIKWIQDSWVLVMTRAVGSQKRIKKEKLIENKGIKDEKGGNEEAFAKHLSECTYKTWNHHKNNYNRSETVLRMRHHQIVTYIITSSLESYYILF
jgi:hypothetical protein